MMMNVQSRHRKAKQLLIARRRAGGKHEAGAAVSKITLVLMHV